VLRVGLTALLLASLARIPATGQGSPTFSINDLVVAEGDSGVTTASAAIVFEGLTHAAPSQLSMLLVAPTGQSVVVPSPTPAAIRLSTRSPTACATARDRWAPF
jgi:hypothetical protein